MFYVSEIFTTAPKEFKCPLQEEIYAALQRLEIPFERVENDPADTMEDCLHIDKVLGIRIVKTLLLCNRQKTDFYLLSMAEDKPFVTKDFSRAMGIARVSFASADTLYEMLGTHAGSATPLSLIRDTACKVKLVIDKALLSRDAIGITDGISTGYVKLRMSDLLDKYFPSTSHLPAIIDLAPAE